MVRNMRDLTTESTAGKGKAVPSKENNSVIKQVILLQEISRELDNYFTRPNLWNEQ